MDPYVLNYPALSYRRYLLLKRATQKALGNSHMEGVWRAAQEAVLPATPLPTNFPYLSVISIAGYTTREDLNGADVHEVERVAKISHQDAVVVIAAFAALPP